MGYKSFPLGQVPEHLQRPELKQLKELGYEFDDPREVITIFEEKVAAFAGSKYAVAVDSCSSGLFLSLKYIQETDQEWSNRVYLPKNTYISVPMQILNAGFSPHYEDIEWSGVYQLSPWRIWDGAVRWTKGMYVGNNALQVVSFQYKKRIPIGKGGMILTDDKEAYDKLKLMSYDGRDLNLPYDHPDHVKCFGYHMYLSCEDAARGIILMDATPEVNKDSGNHAMYPDVEKIMESIGYEQIIK